MSVEMPVTGVFLAFIIGNLQRFFYRAHEDNPKVEMGESLPMTKLLARAIPSRATANPNMIAPNPKAKPKINAHAMAPDGA